MQITHYYPYGLPIKELSTMYLYDRRPLQRYLMTTKEWNNELGLNMYDFGARNYDPATIRWYVQDPAEQFHNPYFAIGGNPVINVDPDGEFIIPAIMIGIMINTALHSGQINNFGDWLGYAAVGAASGALGAGIGAGVGSALMGTGFSAGFSGASTAAAASGFGAGFVSGAAGGFSAGFVSGFGNTAMAGGNLSAMLNTGIKEGLIGAGIGGVGGGIVGGINAINNNKNFWTGQNRQIGRSPFSFNNKPVNPNELFLIDENGGTMSLGQYRENLNSFGDGTPSNPRFDDYGGTSDRFNHTIDVEPNTADPTTLKTTLSSKHIRGAVGIEYKNAGYIPSDGRVMINTNNGFSSTIPHGAAGSGTISFGSRNLKWISSNIFGTAYNNASIQGGFNYKIIARFKF